MPRVIRASNSDLLHTSKHAVRDLNFLVSTIRRLHEVYLRAQREVHDPMANKAFKRELNALFAFLSDNNEQSETDGGH